MCRRSSAPALRAPPPSSTTEGGRGRSRCDCERAHGRNAYTRDSRWFLDPYGTANKENTPASIWGPHSSGFPISKMSMLRFLRPSSRSNFAHIASRRRVRRRWRPTTPRRSLRLRCSWPSEIGGSEEAPGSLQEYSSGIHRAFLPFTLTGT